MNAPAPPLMQPAGLWRRAAGRLVDVLCTMILCALACLAGGIVIVIVALAGGFEPFFGTREGGGLAGLFVVSTVGLALVLAYRYEVVPMTRSGQTLGKRTMGICVVRCRALQGDAFPPPDRASSMRRWAIPHGAATAAVMLSVWIISVGVAAGWLPNSAILLLPFGAFVAVAWAACYVSALWDKDRRGWHDKVAGTVVVCATEEVLKQLSESGPVEREPG